MADDMVSVGLPRDCALVLFDWLATASDSDQLATFADPAEQRALWYLEATLESLLAEPFASDYGEIVDQARARLMASVEDLP
jgi:hypothetical protein